MSKMKMPKVDVVRFTENDVIVASIGISGIGDGTPNFAISYGKNTYGTGDMNSFYRDFGADNHTNIDGTTQVYYDNQGTGISVAIDQLPGWDVQGGYDFYNGQYTWDGTKFVHQ